MYVSCCSYIISSTTVTATTHFIYADLDHSKGDRPRSIANPSLGDGVYDEVLTRK